MDSEGSNDDLTRQELEDAAANGRNDQAPLNHENMHQPLPPSPPLIDYQFFQNKMIFEWFEALKLFASADAEIGEFVDEKRAVLAKVACLEDELGPELAADANIALFNNVGNNANVEDDKKLISRCHDHLAEKISDGAIHPGRIEQVKETFEEIKSWLKNQN